MPIHSSKTSLTTAARHASAFLECAFILVPPAYFLQEIDTT